MIDLLRMCLFKVAALVPISHDDDGRIKELKQQRREDEITIAQTAWRLGLRMSPSIWAAIIGACLYKWEEGGRTLAPFLTPGGDLDVDYDRTEDAGLVSTIRRAVATVAECKDDQIAYTLPRTLVPALIELSAYAESKGYNESAYELFHFSTWLIEDVDPLLSEVASAGLRLALAGGKPTQIAIMAVKSAIASIIKAVDHPEHRLYAFGMCELAIERIALSGESFPGKIKIAHMLMPHLNKYDWLRLLCLRLTPFIANADIKKQYKELLDTPEWPARVTKMRSTEAKGYQTDVENIRLDLSRLSSNNQVTTSEIDWSFVFTEYSRAVPHLGSLLKERELPRRLAVLTHEITHVLSFLGGVGEALLALRVAGIEISSELWRFPSESTPENIWQHILDNRGIAELEEGNTALLFSTERQLEVRRKAQLLLDTWTPWLEGLALYGELGAEPDLDPIRINPVAECVRNLIDFFCKEFGSLQSLDEQARAYSADFERRCSEALRSIGPRRLDDHLRFEGEPYFHGYLAVRAVVAHWRASTNKNLPSAQCFDLLLHATRYGVRQYIPDFGLTSSGFERSAHEGMSAFVKSLLIVEDMNMYFDRYESGLLFTWRDGRLVAVDKTEAGNSLEQSDEYVRRRIVEALSSLTRCDDSVRLKSGSTFERKLLDALAEIAQVKLKQRFTTERVNQLLNGLKDRLTWRSILPIGTCSSPFYLHIY
jgi:hypothetical protein